MNSTNLYAQNLVSKSKPSEGTVVSTFDQRQGRGQIGRKWESEPGKNITFSLILYPDFLAIRQQFLLNQMVSLAVLDLITKYTEKPVKVKWPNDIYILDSKVAGILIQNTLAGNRLQSVIAGIGLNVNQTQFPAEIPNPTSLRLETSVDYELEVLLDEMCESLEKRYLQLRGRHFSSLKKEYLAHLYRFEEESRFQRADGSEFTGCITGITEQGKILIRLEKGMESFAFNEVSYLI